MHGTVWFCWIWLRFAVLRIFVIHYIHTPNKMPHNRWKWNDKCGTKQERLRDKQERKKISSNIRFK